MVVPDNIVSVPSFDSLQAVGQDAVLKRAFLKWQCRVRQMAMRESGGCPNDAVMPTVTLPGDAAPLGHIITVLSKNFIYSVTPELKHIAKRTNDPAQRREKAIEFLSSAHYQKAQEFSDILTATFPPASQGATKLKDAERCRLTFEAYGQRFDFDCEATQFVRGDPIYEATWWHNALFNPNMHPETIVLGFKPDWATSSSVPPPA